MNFTVNPKAGLYWSLGMVVLGVVSANALPSYIPSAIGKEVAETASYLLTLMSAIQAALHGFSSPQAGPLVSSSTPAPKP